MGIKSGMASVSDEALLLLLLLLLLQEFRPSAIGHRPSDTLTGHPLSDHRVFNIAQYYHWFTIIDSTSTAARLSLIRLRFTSVTSFFLIVEILILFKQLLSFLSECACVCVCVCVRLGASSTSGLPGRKYRERASRYIRFRAEIAVNYSAGSSTRFNIPFFIVVFSFF